MKLAIELRRPLRHCSVTLCFDRRFKRAKMKYRTTAERNKFSWVFFSHMSRAATRVDNTFYTDAPWWYAVKAATWNKVFYHSLCPRNINTERGFISYA